MPGKTEMLKTEMLKQGAIDGAVEERVILNDGFWVLNERGRTESSMPLLLQIP